MRRIILCVLIITTAVCGKVTAQESDFMKMIERKDFSKIIPLLEKAYGSDTNRAEYYNILYNYYVNADNTDRDSLNAYHYLKQYNKIAKKKTDTYDFAKSLLANIYKEKNIDKFNRYISLTEDLPALNKEAKRIRNQLAFELLEENPTTEAYQHFISSYPDAPQAEDARLWLNEHLLQNYIRQGNIDSLKSFAATTSSDSYKSKALSEIDRLSFSKALKKNTIDAYMTYIKDFPQGDYVRQARTNIEKVQYAQYVLDGSISDMLYYLDNHGSDDKNYKEVLAKLSLAATEHQSLIAMQKVQSLQSDENLLKRFAVRYISDLDLHAVNMLVETFPALNEDADVTTARTQAEILESLKNKPKLTLEDYKKHRSLFKSLDAHTSAKLFETFEELNSALPKNKALNFGLNNDITYIQFKNAKNTEMNFVLTEKPSEPMTEHKNIKVFAVADTNGFGWFEGSTNRDIFVSLKENGSWSEPFVLPVPVNSRYDECNPVLSSDMTLLYFSSDRGFNFGKKDIYVSVREDVKSWDSWSEPILLSEDLNTKDNDYVTGLNDKVLAISQDDSFNEENTLYLEGNTALDFIKGKVKSKNTHYTSPIRINIYDKQTLALKNIVRTNDKGFFAFLKPQKDVVMNCQASKYFSPLSENSPELYSIEDMVSKQELITVESPFDDNGNITLTGKKNLEILANSFKNTDYMLTIGIHAVKPTSKSDEKTLSEKQALQVIEVLTKNGMNKENIIATGYGKENIMQGWEKTNSMDIGAISK